jgi:lipopolysaccharide/colanic/teichoic acid biosynthesis glycosyltransferase
MRGRLHRRTERVAKRSFDIAVSAGLLTALMPLLGAIALADACILGWPPWFSQRRAGLKGKPFTIWKFRSMTNARDARGQLLPDRERMTRFGAFLRSSSLDELPELFNVLVGDMSLVGPRPLPVEYLERYSEEQMRRHDVPPGITGWNAVNGRNGNTWEERFALDLFYVDNWSLGLDIKILMKTMSVVLRRGGIATEGEVSSPEFKGTGRKLPAG